jgi:hypothetical protein
VTSYRSLWPPLGNPGPNRADVGPGLAWESNDNPGPRPNTPVGGEGGPTLGWRPRPGSGPTLKTSAGVDPAGEGGSAVNYLSAVPTSVPTGRVVVHNRVRPAHPLGRKGFRAWLDEPGDRYEPCDCGWAAETLVEHYRVRLPRIHPPPRDAEERER